MDLRLHVKVYLYGDNAVYVNYYFDLVGNLTISQLALQVHNLLRKEAEAEGIVHDHQDSQTKLFTKVNEAVVTVGGFIIPKRHLAHHTLFLTNVLNCRAKDGAVFVEMHVIYN